MREAIENLVRLQAVELERARLEQEKQRLPSEIDRAQKALAAVEKQSADASGALDREETLRTKLAREIAGHRQKTDRFRVQLDSVTTPAQAEAIEHEMKFAAKETDRLENEAFESLERTEALEGELARARQQVEMLAAARDAVRVNMAARAKEIAGELATLGVSREGLRVHIEPELLNRFDRISTMRGTGIARAENQQCPGCRMGVRPQTWLQLRDGELLPCDSCGRILYWEAAIRAEEPRPELTPGQGQAVRKPRPAGA